MKSQPVDLPVDLVAVAKLDQGSGVSKEASKLIALELFREDRISLGRAADLCQPPIEVFMDYAGSRGGLREAYARLLNQEFRIDRRTLQESLLKLEWDPL